MSRWRMHGWTLGCATGIARLAVAAALIAAAAAMPARAQDTPPAPPAQPDLAALTAEVLPRLTDEERESFAAAISALATLEESKQAAARDVVAAIAADLRGIEAAIAKIADLDQRVANAPILIEQIRAELAQPPASVEPPPDQTVAQLEQGVAQAEAELKAAREDAANLESEAQLRSRLREEIPGVIARTRQEIQGVVDEITSRTTLAPTEPLARAELLRLSVRRRALEQSVAALEREQQSIEARRESLRARQDRATRRTTQAERRAEVWRQRLNEAREAEARRVAEEAKRALRQAANEHEAIQALLRDRTELAGRHEALVSRFQAAQKRRQGLEAEVRSLRARFARSYEEIERVGLTSTVGIILGLRRSELPNARLAQQQLKRQQQDLADALGAQFDYERRRDEVKDVGAAVESLVASLGDSVAAEQREAIRERATEELRVISNLLGQIIETSRDLSEELTDADVAQRALIRVAQEYAAFIDERILWIRSTTPLTWADLRTAGMDLARIGDRALWEQTAEAYRSVAVRDPIPLAALLVPAGAWLLLALSGRRLVRATDRLTDELGRDRLHPSFRPTLEAMLLLALSSLRWPALLLLASLVLAAAAEAPAAVHALVDAMRSASIVWFSLEVARQACREKGFAEIHLRWPRDAAAVVRRHLFWMILIVVPADILFEVAISEGHELSSEAAARLTFIGGMVVLAAFIQRLLRPQGPVLSPYLDPIRGGWMARLSGLWYVILFALPLVLAVLAGLGYFYSAQRLQEGLSATLLLGLSMVILSGLFHRWLWIARRRVAIDQALKRRTAAAEQAEAPAAPAADVSFLTEEEIDLPAANAQTLQLFRSGAVLTTLLALWAIWIDVLPALGLLDRFQIWPTFGPAEVVKERPGSIRGMESVGAQGAAAERSPSDAAAAGAPPAGSPAPIGPGEARHAPAVSPGSSDAASPYPAAAAVESVTLADLLMAIIIGIITLILTRNIPGLLEIAVLQRLPLDAGSRYAVSTIVRYVIVIIGVTVTFGAVGIGWSKIQWLAAALTFGLAFGLQEIFANFISGLIILIERPLRVGDTVTIGDISGEVSRIRMRATTIMQWNRKELIVPNKEFITGQLINWTLSEPTLRIEIPIGIAYGSDTRLARSLLLKVANKCEHVLKDPPPRAVFIGFGDNSLNFELRVFIPHISVFVDARDFVNFNVDDEFRKAGIEIAFPQRDIHIRTIRGVLPVQQLDPSATQADADEKGSV